MKPRKILILVIFSALASFQLPAQKSVIPADPHDANEKFTNNNFEGALDLYLQLLEKEPLNDKYNYRVGVCYLNTNISKKKRR